MGSASSFLSSPPDTGEEKDLTSVLPSAASNNNNSDRSNTGSRQRKRREEYVRDHKQAITDLVQIGVKQILTQRPASFFSSTTSQQQNNSAMKQHNNRKPTEVFMDSKYYKQWLSEEKATALYNYFAILGEAQRPKKPAEADTTTSTTAIETARKVHSKYPLWTKYYGLRRQKDQLIALDRWGSYHESWLRVEDPPEILMEISELLRQQFQPDKKDAVNSMVVNYYFDGEHTYIPAHRDTVACLQDDSEVICLSLGASRDFVFVPNDQCGQYIKSNMSIVKEWRVSHGDVFAIGQETNETYCHAVPQEKGCENMRISIIFRSIDKSFLDTNPKTVKVKEVTYANGKTRTFQAECVVCDGYDDEGEREHIADMIQAREDQKKLNQVLKEQKEKEKDLISESKGESKTSPFKDAKESKEDDSDLVAVIVDKEQAKVLYRDSKQQQPSTELNSDAKKTINPDEVIEKVVTVIPIQAVPLLSDFEKEYFAQNLLDNETTATGGPEADDQSKDKDDPLVISEVSRSGKLLLGGGGSNKLRYSFLSPNETFLTGSPSSKTPTVGGDSRKNSTPATTTNPVDIKQAVIQKTLDSYYMGNGVAVPKINKTLKKKQQESSN